MDKVTAIRTLEEAYRQVAANKGAAGVDHVTIAQFGRDLGTNLTRLAAELRDGTYRPRDIRRVWIPKPGSDAQRPLGIPTVRDRVVQAALLMVIEPIFERDFSDRSYGFRPGKGCKDALREVDGLLKAGYHHVVDVDLRSYFDTIPHGPLMDLVRGKVADGGVLGLIESFLVAGVSSAEGRELPTRGAPQGAVVSPLLSNVYLDPLDQMMAGAGLRMVRYADDFVVLCRSREEAERALGLVGDWVAKAGLGLHPTKTRLVDIRTDDFTFLGYRFTTAKDGRIRRWPGDRARKGLKESLRPYVRRTSGSSLGRIIAEVNPILRGWYGYFRHGHWRVFPEIDGWVRMRLRSLLRKRMGRRGRGDGEDNRRWPNSHFAGLGLFSLATADRLARQPSWR